MYIVVFFFFNDTATTEIYTLSLHDALPISLLEVGLPAPPHRRRTGRAARARADDPDTSDGDRAARPARRGSSRSEEHTSELQSRQYLVCRLLLEKKKKTLHSCILYVLTSHS